MVETVPNERNKLVNARNWVFYRTKPFIPRFIQLLLRRRMACRRLSRFSNIWPVDTEAANPPVNWPGWPEGKQFALILSHDVDTSKGCRNVLKLADLEEDFGFRSCFNFVPERYGKISRYLMNELKRRGFEVGVHGLKHDGKLFSSKKIFSERAKWINLYLREWSARGFTAPSMIRNQDWLHELSIQFSISTFDTDPFEAYPYGVRTIFPFWVSDEVHQPGYLELPYTLAQDFTLFVILCQKNIDTWKQKLSWIAEKGGMALVNSHPDYMNFSERKCGLEEYPSRFYKELLDYVRTFYKGRYWAALPSQVYEFCANRLQHKDLSSNVPSDSLGAHLES